MSTTNEPIIIAGPCVAESEELLQEVAQAMSAAAKKLNCRYFFKASFDKANRTSIDSYRGPGLEKGMRWLGDIKSKYHLPILTDIHECVQVKPVAEVCDVLQIPAFLCRQTDLLLAAVSSGRTVNVKKGQFVSPPAMHHVVTKAQSQCDQNKLPLNLWLTERGASFGYSNLVVDLRSFAVMGAWGVPVIFDITHSTQLPSSEGAGGAISGGERRFAPILARGAAASGYVDGFFLEVHNDPSKARSDKAVQLSIAQATALLEQIIPLWRQSRGAQKIDKAFEE